VGIIYGKVNFQLASCIIFLLASLFSFLMPFAQTLVFLLSLFAVNGICLGFFEAGASVFMLHLWGKEAADFIQALQLMYGAGSLIAPLIAQPFLVAIEKDFILVNGTEVEIFHPEMTKMIYPYSILAAFMAFNAVFLLIIWIVHPETPDHPSRFEEEDETKDQELKNQSYGSIIIDAKTESIPSESSHTKVWKVLIIFLVIIFMHITFGLQVSFGSYLMTFAVNSHMRLSKSIGAYLTTLYWTAFSLTKVAAIFFVNKLGHEVTILISLIMMMFGGALLVPFGDTDVTVLWIGVGLEGIGISSIFACVFGYMELYFPVTDLIGSLIAMSSVLGELSFPVIISHFIEADPQILMIILMGSSCILTAIFLFIMFVCKTKLHVTLAKQ
jgi:FHS family Na+ dependent glucose MFS transporter 1